MTRRLLRQRGRPRRGAGAARPLRILLVTHETTLSGAPRVALLVARALGQEGHRVHVVARAPGPMLPDFQAAADTSLEPFGHLRGVLWARLRSRTLPLIVDTLLACLTLARRRPDLVYVNSTSAAVYMRPARWLRRPVVLHVHESREVATRFLDVTRSRGLLSVVTAVACSPSVRRDVAELTGKPAGDVSMLPSVPDDATVTRLAQLPASREYADDELVVGCCGAVERRKGTDLWITAAREVLDTVSGRDRVRFVWIGPEIDPALTRSASGLEFTGPSDNPYPDMRRFDVATLPSRDDPFPLVVLESMLLGSPVVAFGVGGVAEQIGDAGIVVPPGDVHAFAAAIARLLENDEDRARLGRAAQDRVRTLYSTRAFTAQLARVIDDAVQQH